MRMRQVAFVAETLEPAEKELGATLGLVPCFRDPGVEKWGLKNVLMAVGTDFIEIVSPFEDGTSAGKYLERRGGNGGYMVILQAQDSLKERARINALGVKSVYESDHPEWPLTHFHPRDTGGILLSIETAGSNQQDYNDPYSDWLAAGTEWHDLVKTDVTRCIKAVEIQSADPQKMVALWEKILDTSHRMDEHGGYLIDLDNMPLRFIQDTDGRGGGLGGIDIEVADKAHILEQARAKGNLISESEVLVCGVRVHLL